MNRREVCFQPRTRRAGSLTLTALLAAVSIVTAHAKEWEAIAGAESPDREKQILAFLPNEMWIHAGDSIRWTFPTHERHTTSLLMPNQTRPPAFGPTFGVLVGCPGITPDGPIFNGTACVTSDILLVGTTPSTATPPTYTVNFPVAGDYKVVCLVHNDMTGVVHVRDPFVALPYDQDFYDRQAQSDRLALLADAALLPIERAPHVA